MRIVGTVGGYLAYPHNYYEGQPYIFIKKRKLPPHQAKSRDLGAGAEMLLRGALVIWAHPTMLLTYRRKEAGGVSSKTQVTLFKRLQFEWSCVHRCIDGVMHKLDQRSMMKRAMDAYAAVDQIITEGGLGARVRTLPTTARENVELRATLHALVRECQDMALAAGLYTRDWGKYPPALRKARKILGLPYQGTIQDTEVDPLIESREIVKDEERW